MVFPKGASYFFSSVPIRLTESILGGRASTATAGQILRVKS